MRSKLACLIAVGLVGCALPLSSENTLADQISAFGLQCAAAQFDTPMTLLDYFVHGLNGYDDADTLDIGTLRHWAASTRAALAAAKKQQINKMKAHK